MEQTFELIAKTFQGLEEVLAQELIELGADEVQMGRRMVAFRGDKELMYRANFCLRTAVRILKPLRHFKAKNADEVYEAVGRIDWSEILDCQTTFSIDTTVYSESFRNSKFVAYRVKDAIVDQFMERTGSRPNISLTNPDLRINIHIADEDCTLSLDSSGESLHQRGYRKASVEAPINEVLAAALIKMSGWDGTSDFIDPFCGSGTLLIEAALIARNIYPGVFRKRFAFEAWRDFDAELLSAIYADDSQERPFEGNIVGYDINFRAIEAATANAKAASVADIVRIEQRDIADFVQPERAAIIISNPPYGERLRPADIEQLYATIGTKLKREFVGGEAWLICSREELFDAMRLRPSFKVPLQNGALDCELRKFVSFEGRLENFRAEGGVVKTDSERSRMGEKGRFRDGRKREFSRKRDDFAQPDHQRDDRNARFDKAGNSYAARTESDLPPRSRDFEDDPEMARKYRNLRDRHRTFENVRNAQNNDRGAGRKKFDNEGRGKFRRDNERGNFRTEGRAPFRKGTAEGRDGKRGFDNRSSERRFGNSDRTARRRD